MCKKYARKNRRSSIVVLAGLIETMVRSPGGERICQNAEQIYEEGVLGIGQQLSRTVGRRFPRYSRVWDRHGPIPGPFARVK